MRSLPYGLRALDERTRKRRQTFSIPRSQPWRRTASGCAVWYLPAYSPDLTPIEEAFSKLKAGLRRLGARTREVLLEAIGQVIATITAQDAHGWFIHAGCSLPAQTP